MLTKMFSIVCFMVFWLYSSTGACSDNHLNVIESSDGKSISIELCESGECETFGPTKWTSLRDLRKFNRANWFETALKMGSGGVLVAAGAVSTLMGKASGILLIPPGFLLAYDGMEEFKSEAITGRILKDNDEGFTDDELVDLYRALLEVNKEQLQDSPALWSQREE